MPFAQDPLPGWPGDPVDKNLALLALSAVPLHLYVGIHVSGLTTEAILCDLEARGFPPSTFAALVALSRGCNPNLV